MLADLNALMREGDMVTFGKWHRRGYLPTAEPICTCWCEEHGTVMLEQLVRDLQDNPGRLPATVEAREIHVHPNIYVHDRHGFSWLKTFLIFAGLVLIAMPLWVFAMKDPIPGPTGPAGRDADPNAVATAMTGNPITLALVKGDKGESGKDGKDGAMGLQGPAGTVSPEMITNVIKQMVTDGSLQVAPKPEDVEVIVRQLLEKGTSRLSIVIRSVTLEGLFTTCDWDGVPNIGHTGGYTIDCGTSGGMYIPWHGDPMPLQEARAKGLLEYTKYGQYGR